MLVKKSLRKKVLNNLKKFLTRDEKSIKVIFPCGSGGMRD